MPDDVGGRPFPDGWEPDDDRGGANWDFASVVFDEDFVRAAEIHEPTAVERLLAAAEARAEADAARYGHGGAPGDEDHYDGFPARRPVRPVDDDGECAEDEHRPGGPYGRHGGALRPYRGTGRWHRPVAWVLALVMGMGMVALAFSAVYRGASGNREEQVPQPARTGVDAPPTGATVSGSGSASTAEADRPPSRVPALPHGP